MKELEKLDCSNNALKHIPPEIGYLPRLEVRVLADPQVLLLGGNNVVELPPELGLLQTLEILDLSGCDLVELTPEFTQMTRLLEVPRLLLISQLNLGANQLKTLPDTIGYMTRLCFLNLADNLLTTLPNTLGLCVG